MRVLVAGAAGALGSRVVRRLVAGGHEVVGLTRTGTHAAKIAQFGARVIVGDALIASVVDAAVASASPEAVVHALTAIPKRGPLRASDLKPTNELRIKATRHLLDAAVAHRVQRLVVESMVFVYGFGDLGPDPLTEASAVPVQTPPKPWLRAAIDALVEEERQVLEAARLGRIDGIVLRFGSFYGPGAGIEMMIGMLRKRVLLLPKNPIGMGIPWIHIRDAASAVVAALCHGGSGEIYNIVDDEPARFSDLVHHLARVIHAPPPRSVATWVVQVLAPFAVEALSNTTMRVSNVKAKRDLAWTPLFSSYVEGIADLAAGRPE